MRCYLISDDNYFLLGAEETLRNNNIVAEAISINNPPPYYQLHTLKHNDIVVVAVEDVFARRQLIETAIGVPGRIVFMPSFTNVVETFRELPWILPMKTGLRRFIQVLEMLMAKLLLPKYVNHEHLMIMESICRPELLASIQLTKKMTVKSLSQRKRRLLKRYGLSDSNCYGDFLCRDILSIRKKYLDKNNNTR